MHGKVDKRSTLQFRNLLIAGNAFLVESRAKRSRHKIWLSFGDYKTRAHENTTTLDNPFRQTIFGTKLSLDDQINFGKKSQGSKY